MSTETPQNTQEQPDEAKEYPAPPSITKVETEGDTANEPRRVRISVKYYSHNFRVDPYESVVHYIVRDGTAELEKITGEGKFTDKISAVITASEEVTDVAGVEEVVTLNQIRGQAMKFIGHCEQEKD